MAADPVKAIRLVWDGIPETQFYELQTADDNKFTKNMTRQVLQRPNSTLGLSKLPAFARVRGVFRDRTSTLWQFVPINRYPKPTLPDLIEVKRSESGYKVVPLGEKLAYRVKITPLAGGTAVAESIIYANRYTIPALPGGDFTLSVEVLGNPQSGNIHQDGDSVASTRLETEVIPYDPVAEKQKELEAKRPLDVTDLSQPWVPGLLARGALEFLNGPNINRRVLDLYVQITGEGGFQWYLGLPGVFADSSVSFDAAKPLTTPRLGGGPFPFMGLGYRILGNIKTNLGLALQITPAIDSSGQDSSTPTFIAAVVKGRVTFEPFWRVDYSLLLGSTLSKSVTVTGLSSGVQFNSTKSFSLGVTPQYLYRSKYLIGMGLEWQYRGYVRFTIPPSTDAIDADRFRNSLVLSPTGAYQVTSAAYVRATYSLLVGRASGAETRRSILLSFNVVF